MSIKSMIKQTTFGRKIRFLFKNSFRFRRTQNIGKYRYVLKYYNKLSIQSERIPSVVRVSRLIKKLHPKCNDLPFFHHIDPFKGMLFDGNEVGNLTVNTAFLLHHSLSDIGKIQGEDCSELSDSLIKYVDKAKKTIEVSDIKYKKEALQSFEAIKTRPASSFADALQRIIFTSQLLWQTGHMLNGLGRLDLLLEKYYIEDIEREVITKEDAYGYIKDFITTLHGYYSFKSSVILGDTGQIIILGGKREDGSYFLNDLTYMFILAMKDLQLPDPKVMLRVSASTPRDLIEKALDCICTGIGCPILANDDVIIDSMVVNGYNVEDAHNYTVSACWEPTVAGRAVDMNNIASLNFCTPLIKTIKSTGNVYNYIMFEKKYLSNLAEEVELLVGKVNASKYEVDILLRLFSDSADKFNEIKPLKYMNIGFTGVAISNAVNSLLNIKRYVYEEKRLTLSELGTILENNYADDIELQSIFKHSSPRYGNDNYELVDIVNKLIDFVYNKLNSKTNLWGQKYKFGLSAPSYISDAQKFPATPDGRKNCDPFDVHISAPDGCSFTELVSFASQLDYSKAYNGNVIDYFVSPDFIRNNFDKFVDLLELSIRKGFFELQFNVVSSATLIKAKDNPELFPNLIVRVWGFSAYFNDLPMEYKNVLIERAIRSECGGQ